MTKLKHIYINGRFFTQEVSGVQRVARQMLAALDEVITSNQPARSQFQFRVLMPKQGEPNVPAYQNLEVDTVGKLSGHAWEQVELPLASRGGWLLNLCNTGPLLKSKQTVMIHDAAVFFAPYGYSIKFRLWYRFLYYVFARRSIDILTVSEFSKDELVRAVRFLKEKIHVIHNGVDHFNAIEADYDILDKNTLRGYPFYLTVASANPNKNMRLLVEAAKHVKGDFRFVFAGGQNRRVFASDDSYVFNTTNKIMEMGRVSDSELKALYENALAFVFPSKYEGFGLPPLEAMSCGCPVLASKAASIPEICSKAAIYFDPSDVGGLARMLDEFVSNKNMQAQLITQGKIRAREFTWQQTVEKLITALQKTVYNEII